MRRKHLNITVSGLVQGVGFRYQAQKKAVELGLKGYVVNRPDGALYIEAEGEKDALEKFLKWCRRGPESADVHRVDTAEGEMQNFSKFIIFSSR